MRIIIVGDGKVGHTLMKELSQEGHDIVIIDNNIEVV
ncbi:MAG: NAD(P)-binding domain-containing protein, partial [Clostridiales bacterium]|nr:NAD(P)-binding domain-containing protein [Clostridiales bacterium]